MDLTDSDLGYEIFKHPARIKHFVISDIERRMDGDLVVSDPNNSFCTQLDATGSIVAGAMQAIEHQLRGHYTRRIRTMEDLYKNLSDFDHVGINGSPASTTIDLVLSKSDLKNALKYNDNYNKVVIPKDTVFYIGNYPFSLYYPIEILINRTTNTLTVTYNTDDSNPLHSLSYTNIPFVEYTWKHLPIVKLTFPIYQFMPTMIEDTIVRATGYVKTVSYTDKFYAVRAWYFKDGIWSELSLAFSDVYNVKVPTLKVRNLIDVNKLQFSIPQIYINNGSMGSKIRIQYFLTKGNLDVDLTTIQDGDIKANFAFDHPNTDEFSTILNRISTIQIVPTEDKLVGGHDGYDFEELKRHIINDTLHDPIPISPADLAAYGERKGFTIVKQLDNLTVRVYYALRLLKDKNNTILPMVNGKIKLDQDLIDNCSSILQHLDNSVTVLPNTIFKNVGNDIYEPLSDVEITAINNRSPEEFVTDLNNNIYTRTPFHLRMLTTDQYPRVDSYNLMSPSTKDLIFIKDNITISTQMSVVSSIIIHDNNLNGFTIRLGVMKQADLVDVDEDNVLIYLTTTSVTGILVGLRATKIGMSGDIHVYDAVLSTEYHLNSNNEITITSFDDHDGAILALESTFNIILAVASDSLSNGASIDTKIVAGIPSEYNNFIGVARQQMTCSLGSVLTSTILNNLDISWSPEEYFTYPANIPETWDKDQFEHNPNGTLVVNIVDDEVVLNKTHSEGDIVLDGDSNPVIKHNEGDIKLFNGNKVVENNRDIIYYIDAMLCDLKLFVTDNPTYKDWHLTLAGLINSYLSVVAEAGVNMERERTFFYFRPVNTLGYSKFGTEGQATVTLSTSLSFAFTIFTTTKVKADDTLKEMIKNRLIELLKLELAKQIISMVNVGDDLSDDLSDYVSSVSVNGINGISTLQTLVVQDTSIRPIIKRKLVYEDNAYDLIEDVTIDWVATDE